MKAQLLDYDGGVGCNVRHSVRCDQAVAHIAISTSLIVRKFLSETGIFNSLKLSVAFRKILSGRRGQELLVFLSIQEGLQTRKLQ